MSKADYVREKIRDGRAGDHHCHWPGCERKVPPAAWGCMKHWKMLPLALQRKIWAAFRPGQEVSKTPTRDYVEAAHEVQMWIRQNHPPAPRLL